MGIVKYGVQDEAKELAYDNTNTGLAASTIQQAIDLLQSTKEPANSNILKTSNIGVTVQAYNSNLTGINQGLSTTSNVTFNSVDVNGTLSVGPYNLPTVDGRLISSGTDIPQVLQTNGAGVVSWSDKVDSGWNDLTSEIIVRGAASSSPVWAQMGSNAMYAYNFGVGKKAFVTFHIKHDYKPGGDILIHIHWTTSGTNTNTVKWKIDYTVAKGHNQSSGGDFFPMNTVYLELAASGTSWRHMVSEMSASIALDNAEVDSLILVVFERVTNGGTDNSDDVFGLTVDCHYQTDRSSTLNRAPNFYS